MTGKFQKIIVVISFTLLLINVSAQSGSNEVITPENASRLEVFQQLGYGTITDIEFSSDGNYFAVGTGAGIALYSMDDLSTPSRFFEGGTGTIEFSPDSTLLAADRRVWDVESGSLLYEYEGKSPKFKTSGDQFIVASGQDIQLLNSQNGNILLTQAIEQGIRSIDLSKNNIALVVDSLNNVTQWDLAGDTQSVELEATGYPTIYSGESVFSPDSGTLLQVGWDGYTLWNVETGKAIRVQQSVFNPVLNAATFSPDGTQIAIGDGNASINIYNTLSGETLGSFRHKNEVKSVAFSPDGKLLAAAATNGVVYGWNVNTREEAFRLMGYSEPASVYGFNETDTVLTAATFGGAAWQWDLQSGAMIGTGQGYKFEATHGTIPYPSTIELNESANVLATGSVIEGLIRLWKPNGDSEGVLELGDTKDVIDVVFTLDGSKLAGLAYKFAYIWDITTGERISEFQWEDDFAFSVALNSDGSRIAIGYQSGTVSIYDVKTASVLTTFQGGEDEVNINHLTFSPDGRSIAFSHYCWSCAPEENDYSIQLWDVETGDLKHKLDGHTDSVSQMSFDQDGSLLVSISRDGTLRFWDPIKGQELASKLAFASTFAFSNDESVIATNHVDGRVWLWSIGNS